MNDEEREKLKELEDARADHESGAAVDEDEPSMSPQTGGPGLAGLTPPD